LIVPHAVRLLFGEDLRIVLPGSLLGGAGFLIAADTVARIALAPLELPGRRGYRAPRRRGVSAAAPPETAVFSSVMRRGPIAA